MIWKWQWGLRTSLDQPCDSGAKISIVNRKLIQQILPEKIREIRPLRHKVVLVSVTNDRKSILGKLEITFYIGTIMYRRMF